MSEHEQLSSIPGISMPAGEERQDPLQKEKFESIRDLPFPKALQAGMETAITPDLMKFPMILAAARM